MYFCFVHNMYRRKIFFIFGLTLISSIVAEEPTSKRGYFFTAPKRLVAGEKAKVCLSLYNLEPPVHVNVDLISSSSSANNNTGSEDIFATSEATIKNEIDACLELQVPTNTNYSEANLRLSLKFDKHPDYVVRAQKQVSIEHDMLVTFVETDKPIYKPGQNVNIRILNLKPDLKPWTKPIPKIWIENPAEVRVAQWTDVKTENGMAQLSFPLSDESNSGDWKIVVEKTKPEFTQTSRFEVREYVLPRFQVTIESPKYILAYDTNATWKVCAKYSYGEPVKGLLVLTLKPEIPYWVEDKKNEETKYEAKINTGSDGCINYTANAKELGLTHRYTPNSINAQVNFTEAKTGINETATSTTAIKTQPLTIETYEPIPKYFKPGLPFYGKFQVLRADGSSPAPNENIQICLKIRCYGEWYQEEVACRNFTSSNPDGLVDFSVAPQNTSINLLTLSATAIDYPTDYDLQRYTPTGFLDVEAWYSNSSSYIQVTKVSAQPIVCGQKYLFNVTYTSPGLEDSGAIDFHYLINSKGDILLSDHIKDEPRKESRVDDSELQGENVLDSKKSATTTKESSSRKPYVYRFPLSINVTLNMAPKADLLLYYIRPDGEVVSTTQSIKIDQCFENPVKLTWQEEKMQPGSMAKLQVEAAPDSLCGVSAVDKSTRFLKTDSGDSHLLQPETVSARLKTLDQSNGYVYRPNGWTGCDQKSINHSNTDDFYYSSNPYVDINVIKNFDDSGNIIMSDLVLCSPTHPDNAKMFPYYFSKVENVLDAVAPLPSIIAPSGISLSSTTVQLSTPTIIRSYFPETWIWELIPTGSQGKTVIERKLPDTITDWIGNVVCLSSDKGLGIGAPSQITAFQPFFLDYILPYSVRRGEQLHLKVSLFNYMSQSLPVIIKLLDHEGLDLAGNLTETTFCVQPKDSVVHEFLLIPTKLGELNVSVAAEINVDPKKTQDCSLENHSYVRDQIVKPVLVKAEGFPVEISKSAFLCPKDFSNDSSLEWELELPKPEKSNEKVVDGSVKAHVSVIGDILGPALDNLENLIQLPMGCGEQNMILFVPNIHAIAYLDAAKRPTAAETRKNALNNMRKGYQRELNYRHSDGSYSAFGSSDKEGSMWLTAFVIKSFSQARKMIEIDERDLKISVDWITNRQLENGCFPVVGQVFHKDMKGGLTEETGSSSTLTAYVLIALLESKVPLPASVTDKALQCLENSNSSSDSSTSNLYGEALKSYALALLEHPKAKESLQAFMSRASQQNERLWWEDKNRPDSLSLSIETTAYGVLSLLKLGGEANTVEAFKAVRWLSSKRNPQGGFSSTQDTVLGLEAITKYALTMNNGKATDLTVSVTASDMKQNYKIDEVNRMVLQSSRLPSLPTKVEVSAKGEGCLLVQSSLKYNKVNTTKSDAFEVSVNVDTNSADSSNSVYSQSEDACSVQRLTICSRYKLPDGESNMALLEVGMVTGLVPDRSSLQELLKDPSNGVKRFEVNQDTVVIYFEKLTSQNSCISFQAIRENVVDNPKPGNIKLYDYYQQEHSISKNYKFTEVCKKEN